MRKKTYRLPRQSTTPIPPELPESHIALCYEGIYPMATFDQIVNHLAKHASELQQDQR